ncbi:hypothetical protein F5X68DRAFT_176877 [Plectosphaerella plurivora]|uniref:Uncharacterized protein n=1 Tax=Plectosphaerella plurivora TaxID=936078 RepID=A0A9P9A7D0_9PEZI|nr:hypothetical protein F5X68DRAFT_176877 [Plectosphaerella plurivora]
MNCRQEDVLKFTQKDIPNLSGHVVIVTGGNSGIGYETTKQLALNGARVYIASRSSDRVQAAITRMNHEVGEDRNLDLRFLKLNLEDLTSVKAAARWFTDHEDRLDILINNAGVMNAPYKLTVDGLESQWQINYLAPHLLTTSLMPLMLKTAAKAGRLDRVRVVNVVSNAAFFGPKTIQFEDVNMTDAKGMMVLWQRYGHAKQASIRDAKEINDRFGSKGVTAYSVHPGIVKTNLQSTDPSMIGSLMRMTMKLAPSASALDGALNSLFCATSPRAPAVGQGRYFVPVAKLDSVADVWLNDTETNARLWEESAKRLEQVV